MDWTHKNVTDEDGTDEDGIYKDGTDEKGTCTPLLMDDVVKDFMKEFVHFALFDHTTLQSVNIECNSKHVHS